MEKSGGITALYNLAKHISELQNPDICVKMFDCYNVKSINVTTNRYQNMLKDKIRTNNINELLKHNINYEDTLPSSGSTINIPSPIDLPSNLE